MAARQSLEARARTGRRRRTKSRRSSARRARRRAYHATSRAGNGCMTRCARIRQRSCDYQTLMRHREGRLYRAPKTLRGGSITLMDGWGSTRGGRVLCAGGPRRGPLKRYRFTGSSAMRALATAGEDRSDPARCGADFPPPRSPAAAKLTSVKSGAPLLLPQQGVRRTELCGPGVAMQS